MIIGGFFIMFFFIAPLSLVAVMQARRRHRWLRAAGEIFCLEQFGDDDLEEMYGEGRPGEARRAERAGGGAASLQLDFLSPCNILAWARLRQVVCHLGWRFSVRLAVFLSMVAVCLVGLLGVVLYASVVTVDNTAVPQARPPARPLRIRRYVLCS
eukprot:tig00000334_g24112.t1